MLLDFQHDEQRQTQTAALLDQIAAENEITPFADPFAIGIGDMLDTEPPPRRWLLDNLLPLGVVGLLAAGGGTGKSVLTLQLAISIATGRPFMGLGVGEPGGVLMIVAEDDREEIHRRLWRVVQHLRADGDLDDYAEELLRERLFVASRVGQNNLLTTEHDRVVIRTTAGQRIEKLVEQLPPIRLIVLDPVSRFRGGDENANEAATRFVESVESIRATTGATVLLPHHVNKSALSAGSEAISVEGMRGASALLDGVRWAAAMATLRKDHAGLYGIDPEDAGHYVRLDTVKNNYAALWAGMWLERLPGGVLVPVEMEKQGSSEKAVKKAAEDEDRYQETVAKIKNLVRKAQERGDPLSVNRLRQYAGVGGLFNMGDKRLRGIIKRAIEESQISSIHWGARLWHWWFFTPYGGRRQLPRRPGGRAITLS